MVVCVPGQILTQSTNRCFRDRSVGTLRQKLHHGQVANRLEIALLLSFSERESINDLAVDTFAVVSIRRGRKLQDSLVLE